MTVMPGRILHRIVLVACATDLRDRVLEPAIADLQREWLDAEDAKPRLLALARGYAGFWGAFMLGAWRMVAHEALIAPDTAFTARAARALTIAVMVACAVAAAAAVRVPVDLSLMTRSTAALWSAVDQLPYALAIGLLPAMLYARAARPNHRLADAIKLAIALMVFLTLLIGWVVPRADRTLAMRRASDAAVIGTAHDRAGIWDEDTWRRALKSADRPSVAPGADEVAAVIPGGMTWPELMRATHSDDRHSPSFGWELHRRAALIGLAIAVAMFGWIAGARDSHVVVDVIVWYAVAWALTIAAPMIGPPRGSVFATWLPVVTFVAAAPALHLAVRQRTSNPEPNQEPRA